MKLTQEQILDTINNFTGTVTLNGEEYLVKVDPLELFSSTEYSIDDFSRCETKEGVISILSAMIEITLEDQDPDVIVKENN